MFAKNLTEAEIDKLVEDFDRASPKTQRLIVADFCLRLTAIQKKLENIVCTKRPDDGVVLLSEYGPTTFDPELQIQVYDHEHFSPLGDALIELYEIAGGTVE